MAFSSSPEVLQGWSSWLLTISVIATGIALATGYASTLLSNRAQDQTQAANTAIQNEAKARIADADKRAAGAYQRASEADERAAIAHHAAEKARERAASLELEAARIARELDNTVNATAGRYVTNEQRDILIRELKGTNATIEICAADDADSKRYTLDLTNALEAAGQDITYTTNCAAMDSVDGRPVVGLIHVGEPEEEPLYRAFKAAGLLNELLVGADAMMAPDDLNHRVIAIPRRLGPPLHQLVPGKGLDHQKRPIEYPWVWP